MGNINKKYYIFILLSLVIGITYKFFLTKETSFSTEHTPIVMSAETIIPESEKPKLNIVDYDKKILENANLQVQTISSSSTSTLSSSAWPVKTTYPNFGALLPFNRIVAYYGNLYSKYMGVLGEYPENIMLDKLLVEVNKWEKADPKTAVIPALHYIAVVAQAGPGRDGKYRARMPDKEIDKVLSIAKKINALVFLDIQLGFSNLETELPLLKKYLKLPNVHLGIDPEFAMPGSKRPGTVIGTLDAKQINIAANFLATTVQENNLTPKILVIHRFTKPMVTNYKNITPLPEVQIVIDMDGFGSRGSKLNTYKQYITKEPVQFTGFKLFYKNDIVNSTILTPEDLLKLTPIPLYIQFQ